jgi:YYY domain-containing protein
MSFSIGFELISKIKYQISNLHFKNQIHNSKIKMLVFSVIGGLVTAYLVTMAGNMQTIYAYTRGYTGENVKPFWELFWGINELPARLEEGMNTYWYANATRFIPYTIHEFPSYSFVVSDVHGHVMSLPFVLLAIALLINFYGGIRNNPVISGKNSDNPDQDLNHSDSLSWADSVFFGILLAVLFMTNVLDAPIYGMLFLILGFLLLSPNIFHFKDWFFKHATNVAFVAFAGPAIIPFILKFKSFVTGLAVDCPPKFLENHKIGPFLFETVDKCQKSPLWMMWLLWGFFIFCGAWLIITKLQYQKLNIKFKDVRINLSGRISQILKQYSFHFSQTELVLLVFFLYSISLIIFPEFFYFKDIYPQHFRSNTMFKLGYQAFILFSIVSGYAIVRTMLDFTNRYRLMTENFPVNRKSLNYLLFFVLLLPQLFLVCIYPSFSVKSYFGKLGNYKTLDGLSWLMNQYPDDYAVINWFNEKLAGCGLKSVSCTAPVIVEADSDSYTDYARFSAFTGAPTVVGWAVHEWLWRGTYDIVAPRRDDVAQIYESPDVGMTEKILARYDVSYIFVGTLEREKYKNLNEEKIARIASVVFSAGDSKLYRVNNLTFNGL